MSAPNRGKRKRASESVVVGLAAEGGIDSPPHSKAHLASGSLAKQESMADGSPRIPDEVIATYSKLLPLTSIQYLHSPFVTGFLEDTIIDSLVHKTYEMTLYEAAEEFRRFIALKVFVSDFDAEKLSPTPLMDNIWHAAILDTRFYAALQKGLGCIIHHRPKGAREEEADSRKTRLAAMKALYEAHFNSNPLVLGTPPRAIGDQHPATTSDEASTATGGLAPRIPASGTADLPVEKFTFSVRYQNDCCLFNASPKVTVGALFHAVETKFGIARHQFRLLFDRSRLGQNGHRQTLVEEGVSDGDIIEIHREMVGC